MLVTEHTVKTPRHTTFYLAAGPEDGVQIIFVHGWPELSISWRHQLPVFAGLGFRVIAPDMRGYGRSSVYDRHEDYALAHATADMIELLDSLGAKKAVWVGHDWGSPVVWSIATHHPDRCHGVANLCVPHVPAGFVPQNLIPLVDRTLYPEDQFPAGQWEYMMFYLENFDAARAPFEAHPERVPRAFFRKGNPDGKGVPAGTAHARRLKSFIGGLPEFPDVPADRDVLSEEDEHRYASSMARNGFFGPDSWYMNIEPNLEFAKSQVNGGRIAMPVLFLHASYDYTCMTIGTRLADPMREACSNLTEVTVDSGHWMAQEKPRDVNSALARWLAKELPAVWVK